MRESRRVRRHTAIAALLLILAAGRTSARGAGDAVAGDHAVVVELFTSQGCSSCPPADQLLVRLGEERGAVIPLAFHVDFWNHDGWTDPFSRHAWTERQEDYEHALQQSQLYTPQAVVDGSAQLVGSNEDGLRAAIASAASRPAARITVRVGSAAPKTSVEIDVNRPPTLLAEKLDLMLAVFETDLVTAVGSGENGGRTLRNSYVVRSLTRVAKLPAKEPAATHHVATVSLDSKWNRSRLGVAAFLQDPRTLKISGAASGVFSGGGAR